MASFDVAIREVLKHEGGYVYITADSGGETYRGIARKFNPAWIGWGVIDDLKASRPISRGEIIKNADPYVFDFYKKNFWQPQFDNIRDQRAANIALDSLTLHGIAGGSLLIQQALNSLGAGLVLDRQIGPKTIQAINNSTGFVNALITARESFVNDLVKKRPKDAVFLKGWITRFQSYAVPAVFGLGGLLSIGFFLPSCIA